MHRAYRAPIELRDAYDVRVHREDDWWHISVPDLGLAGQAWGDHEVLPMAQRMIASWCGVDADSVTNVTITWVGEPAGDLDPIGDWLCPGVPRDLRPWALEP